MLGMGQPSRRLVELGCIAALAIARLSGDPVIGHPQTLNQGSVGVIIYKVPPGWTDLGVELGSIKFKSYPAPAAWPPTGQDTSWCNEHKEYNGPPSVMYLNPPEHSIRFALVTYPRDSAPGQPFIVHMQDEHAHNVNFALDVKVHFAHPSPVSRKVSAPYLVSVTRRFKLSGQDYADNFVTVNHRWRVTDSDTLSQIGRTSADHFLWSGAFYRPRVQVVRTFGEIRRYRYRGKLLDEELHSGIDLPGARTDVPAINDGTVVAAVELKVYGKCIVIDHGYGLQSIYAHLSTLVKHKGDQVKKGDVIGESGDTGFTEGDVLHLGFQLNGIPVTPTDWWDEVWLGNTFTSPLSF